ncbi:MAG: isopentenyl-diphosphate Delta-isomerase, partial [Coriobacteriia bacterium]|nr:isopentenyl-diphosphate Delta-isomerase [Coriobacteriia bacterium]
MTSPDAHYLPAGGAARAAWLEDELVVAVDRDDNEMGLISRGVAHEYDGVLHRAFMVLLTDEKGRFLLARRSNHKRLWPGVWADSCAGHPRPAEDTVKAARRRVHEELGCEADIIRVGSFVYRTTYPGRGCEHELCHVMVGRAIGDFQPDPAEV